MSKASEGKKKRRKFFQYVHQRNFDIILLQETHSCEGDEKRWRSEFGGETLFSHGTKESRGVMICFRKKCPVQVRSVKRDEDGRSLFCEVRFEDTNLCVANVYAPNQDKPDFFRRLFGDFMVFAEKIEGGSEGVIAGDLNLVLDLEKDKVGGTDKTHDKSAKIVQSLMDDENMIDIWRLMNPDEV